jgi:mannose-6-phosphate isomerase-like protein (cupin superfamily)
MHIAPAEFRSVRTGGTLLRFALLGDVAYVLADVPAPNGQTVLEDGCEREHWAFVVDGGLTLESEAGSRTVDAETAFHVPGGTPHRMVADASVRVAGFAPIEPGLDTTDSGLRALGFEIVREPLSLEGSIPLVAPPEGRAPERGRVSAVARKMGGLIFTRAVLGARSGYTASWCDVPHWGLVTAGALAIEWEDDIEVLSAGDVYYCPAGPPGHRLQSAEGATIIDFTPIAGRGGDTRMAAWRQEVLRAAIGGDGRENGDELAVAPLR